MPVTIRTPDDLVTMMHDVFDAETGISSDRNVGSTLRTLFEAAALADSEQFIQIVRALDGFFIDTATGDDLDRRASDYDIVRLAAAKATTTVRFGDTRVAAVVTATLTAQVNAGAANCTINDATGWPAAGFVILDRANGSLRERLSFTRVNTTLTFDGALPAYTHANAGAVYLSVQGSDGVIGQGTRVIVPATAVSAQISFVTTEQATIFDGDRLSDHTDAQAESTGEESNVAANRIIDFGAKPFEQAFIYSNTMAGGGRARETDAEFRARIRAAIRALPRSTKAAIASGLIGVTSGVTAVASAQTVDSLTAGKSTVYIDDGTDEGITLATLDTTVTREVALPPTTTKAGDKRGHLKHAPLVALTGGTGVTLLKTPVGAAYRGTGTVLANVVTDAGKAWTPAALVGWLLVDAAALVWTISANTDTTITLGANDTPAAGVYSLVNPAAPEDVDPVGGSDFVFDLSTGDFEYTPGYSDQDTVVVTYHYYGGIVEEAQKVVNGVTSDLTTYPGLKAIGTQVLVTAPTTDLVLFNVSVTPTEGTPLSVVSPGVKNAIQQYVNSLAVAQDVSMSKVIAAIMSVPAVEDVSVTVPAGNVGVADGHVAKTNDASITVG